MILVFIFNPTRAMAPDLFKIGAIGMRSGELDPGRL
jgi:hypothetical protein